MAELPQSFKERIKQQLGDEYEAYEASFNEKFNNGLRVNNLKLSAEEYKKIDPFNVEPVRWIDNGFYYSENEDEAIPSKHPYYFAGLYYIQEPSAMTPASLLPVEKGDRVLDLCAAPGGKSTELAAKLQGEGVLVANDISNSRAKALLKNLEVFGAKNTFIVSEAPSKLVNYFEGYFDKILVDAPCSGEGMFRKSPAIIKNWEQYGVEYYHKLQLEILPCAVRMLKPGGYLLYSTCTFSPLENEGTLKYLLDTYEDLEVVQTAADDDFEGKYAGFVHADPALVDGPEEIRHALRLWPHRIKGEGHFVALLRKKALGDGAVYNNASYSSSASNNMSSYGNKLPNKLKNKISDEALEFFSHLKLEIDYNRLEVKEDRIYMLPAGLPPVQGLRTLRSGLLLGEMKKNRFEPSQALACALKAEEYDNIYNMSADDPDVMRYLRCETVELKHECKDGWVLMCVDGYPLGFAKVAKGSFKNKYLPGWRCQF